MMGVTANLLLEVNCVDQRLGRSHTRMRVKRVPKNPPSNKLLVKCDV